MADINFATREVTCKIVYYGPGRSGKTTNLEWVHAQAPSESVGEMISVATETDRTIFFDFLSLDLGQIAGMTTKFQLYTVPGQVYYNATRKIVLQGADGVVFVADSDPEKRAENIESLDNLTDNLRANSLDLDALPLVFQWNKRDLGNAMAEELMEEELNPGGLPSNATVAIEGRGVFKTLKGLASIVIKKLNEDLPDDSVGAAGAEEFQAVAAAEAAEEAEEEAPAPAEAQPLVMEETELEEEEPGAVPEPLAFELAPEAEPAAETTYEDEPESAEELEVSFDEEMRSLSGDAPKESPAEEQAMPGLVVTAPVEPAGETPLPAAEPRAPEPEPEEERPIWAPLPAAPPMQEKETGPAAGAAEKPKPFRRFRWRLLAGVLGAVALCAVQWVYFWTELRGGWADATGGAEEGMLLNYVAMGGTLFGVVLVCGLVAAFQDRSAVRCIELGICWMAVVSAGLWVYRSVSPEIHPDEPVGVRMAEIGVSPGLLGRTVVLEKRARRAEEDLKALKAEQELASKSLLEETQGKLDAAQAANKSLKAQIADLGKQIEAARSDVTKARGEAASARKAAGKDAAEKKRQIDALKKALAEAQQKLKALEIEATPEPGADPGP